MLPLIIKGFLPQQNGSSIMVAADVVTIAGSDYDIDKMYLRIPAFNAKDLKKITYDLGTDSDVSTATASMTKEQRDNLMIDMEWEILTSTVGSEQMFNPCSFDDPKKMSRISEIMDNLSLLGTFADSKNIPRLDFESIYTALYETSLDDLDKFLKEHKKEACCLTPQTFIYNHEQNMVGSALIGLYANGASVHTKMQDASLSIIASKTFTINGRVIQKMDAIYNGLGELIQNNIAQIQSSSVDNAKDPVLAKLRQNINTANTMLFMLRAGLSIEEASLLFLAPLKGTSPSSFKGIIKYLSKVYNFKVEAPPVTSAGMAKAKMDSNLYKRVFSQLVHMASSKLDDDEFRKEMNKLRALIDSNSYLQKHIGEVIQNAVAVHAIYDRCKELTRALKKGNNILKADSPNNGLEVSIAGGLAQERAVTVFEAISKDKEEFPFEGGTSNIAKEFIRNGIIDVTMSRAEMREALMGETLPSLQAFYSLGIELPLYCINKYFIHGNRALREGLKLLMDNAYGGNLDDEVVEEYFRAHIKYALSKTDLFGEDFDKQRSYFLHTFPQIFVDIVNKIPELRNNPSIMKLSHNLETNAIEFKRSGKLTPLIKATIRADFNNLLYSDNPEVVKLAKSLFMYSYYHDGMAFGPNNFGYFFDATFWNCFPEVVNAVRTIGADITQTEVERFIEMFLANNPNSVKTVSVDKKVEGSDVISFPKNKGVESYFTKYGVLDYFSTPQGYLYKLMPDTLGRDAVSYKKIPVFNDLCSVYNAASNPEEMESLYYTSEDNDTNVKIQYTDLTTDPTDSPSQTELLVGSGEVKPGDIKTGDTKKRVTGEEEVDRAGALIGNRTLTDIQDQEAEETGAALNAHMGKNGSSDLSGEDVIDMLAQQVYSIQDKALRKRTGDSFTSIMEANVGADGLADTASILPELEKLVKEALAEDKGECNVPSKY